MALFAETLVEEALNRRGYFTVRGAKAGQREMDLLAVRPRDGESPEALHVEVQASTNPISWITKWTKRLQSELNIPRNSMRPRTFEQLAECAEGWVGEKFTDAKVQRLRESLWSGLDWRFRLVHGVVAHPEELDAIKAFGIETVEFATIVSELVELEGEPIRTTSSTAADIAALIGVDRKARRETNG
ncbi:MAG: hypothetical protein M3R38_00495 [Actinomycetota bacterium]|nr:hypothetical protein [Actinomycetota bacterium]